MISTGLLIYLITPFLAAVSQIMLKISASKDGAIGIRSYLNLRVIAAYVIFAGCMLLNIVALQTIEVSLASVLECASYVYVIFLGHWILHEKISWKKAAGNTIIIAGIALCLL